MSSNHQNFMNQLQRFVEKEIQRLSSCPESSTTSDNTSRIRLTMHAIADGLRENGCSDVEIRLALLAWCGVPVSPLKISLAHGISS